MMQGKPISQARLKDVHIDLQGLKRLIAKYVGLGFTAKVGTEIQPEVRTVWVWGSWPETVSVVSLASGRLGSAATDSNPPQPPTLPPSSHPFPMGSQLQVGRHFQVLDSELGRLDTVALNLALPQRAEQDSRGGEVGVRPAWQSPAQVSSWCSRC